MEAKKKLEEKKRIEMMTKSFEEKEKQRKEQIAKEKVKLQEEIENNGGVYYSVELTPVPLANSSSSLETDRIKLPPSALENVLIKQDALKASSFSSPVLFELSLLDLNNRKVVIRKTHAGVSEFTAEEGTVGIPIKTAMSLTQDVGGLDFLESNNNPKILVKYKVLDRYPKIVATFQPKGYGFHEKGEKEVSIDLKSTLERVLQNHMALTQGDIVPLRHNGKTFHLQVKSLEPDTALCIRDTEVQVDFLPSEQAEKEIELRKKIEAMKRKSQEEEERLRHARKERIRKIIPFQQQQQGTGQPTINIQVRYGNTGVSASTNTQASNKIQSSFPKTVPLKAIFDWVALSLIDIEPPIGSLKKQMDLGLDYEFQLVNVISPGNRLTLKPTGDYAMQSLESYGIKSSSSFFLEYIDPNTDNSILFGESSESSASSSDMEVEPPRVPSTGIGLWRKAFEDAEKGTDVDISTYVASSSSEDEAPLVLSEEEKTKMLNDLRGRNVTPFNALMAIQKFARQLIELENMGFIPDTRAIELLTKYQGRTERVVNILSEEQLKYQSALTQSQKQQEDEGTAVTQRNSVGNAEMEMDNKSSEGYDKELEILHGVGLVDDSRSIMLLKKYNRDVEKVINILLS